MLPGWLDRVLPRISIEKPESRDAVHAKIPEQRPVGDGELVP
ncbi:hypothetical protein ACIQ7Q_04915 [Streptomyces sp. NPDC096176]